MPGLELENRPWYFAVILGVVLAGFGIWGAESQWLSGIEKDIANRTSELESLKQKVREGKAAEARLPQFREEFARLDSDLQRLLRILPTQKQTDELIKKIKALTEQGSFRFVGFEPQGFQKKDFYTEWPIRVSLEAGYHDLAKFFDRLSKFSRIINVETLSMVALNKPGPYTLSAGFTMKTFIYGEVASEGAAR
ncbi:MAG: type 4a pilus biogenesis protein PilO [Thermoanaerobaculum sp.]|nr:type 4a pilus biogenesis protein PilO [Thermoanaerobaculum sp.]